MKKIVFPQLKYTFQWTEYQGTFNYSTVFCPDLLYHMSPKSFGKYRNCRCKFPDARKYVTATPPIFTKTCSLSLTVNRSFYEFYKTPANGLAAPIR